MVEPESGRIVIDGVDIATLGVRELRSQLSIIPQDPFMWVELQDVVAFHPRDRNRSRGIILPTAAANSNSRQRTAKQPL
jgi:ABC-type transport system involved in Fe-S cluster assembly fused permease/ATPase subunit